MAAIEKIREVMQHNEEKKYGLRKSILMLMIEWKSFEEDIDIAARCLIECSNELQDKEKHLNSVQESVTESSKELELIRESVEKKEQEFHGRHERELNDLECKWEEFNLARKEYDGVVKLREEKLNEQEKMVKRVWGEVEAEHKQLEDIRKCVEDRFVEISMKEKEFDNIRSCLREDTDVFRLKERKFMEQVAGFEVTEKRLQLMEQELKRRSEEMNKIQSSVHKETDALHLQDKKFMEQVAEFEVKEKRLQSMEQELEVRSEESNKIQSWIHKETDTLHLQERNFMERVAEFEKEMENKERGLDSARKELMVKENCLNNVKKELRGKETRLDSVKRELREKEHDLDSIRKELRKRETTLDLVKKQLRIKEDCLSSVKKEIELKEIALKEKQVEVRCRELKQREKLIDNQFKLLDEKEKQLKTISCAPVNADPIDYVEVDTKETLTSSISKASTCNVPHSDSFGIILIGMGGKNLQTFLNDHWEEHELLRLEVSRALKISTDSRMLVLEALEGFYATEPHKGEIECNRNIIRKSCILLLEELMRISPDVTPNAKLEASKVASDWKAKMMAEMENHLTIFGFLFLVGAYGLASAFDKNELESLCSTVAKHGQVTQICNALGISVINGEPVSNYVGKWSKQQNWSIIHRSSDPAKVVLDALRKCHSAKGQLRDKKRKRNSAKGQLRFPDLLEQLRGVSPEIRAQVKIEATEFAVAWRATLTESWEVISFFNFLVTFELSSLFDSDDLLGLLEMVKDVKWPINLIETLRIADKVPCFIEKLIQRKEWLRALEYIHEFRLVDMFPPVPLLKKYVSDAIEQAKEIRGNGPYSREAREKAIICELSGLRATVEHIWWHNLQSKYSADPLKARISELEKDQANCCAPTQPIPQVQKAVEKRFKAAEPLHPIPTQLERERERFEAAAAGVMLRKFPGPNDHFIVAPGVPPPFVPCVYPFYHHQNSWHPGY